MNWRTFDEVAFDEKSFDEVAFDEKSFDEVVSMKWLSMNWYGALPSTASLICYSLHGLST
jgi:hypothetical protein